MPVGVSVAPQIPFVTEDMEQVLEAAWEAGARCAFYTVIRLPWEVAPLFKQWLELHYPQRADRIMARIREMRGGKDYDADFATRMKGSGLWADLIRQRFEKATQPHRLQPRSASRWTSARSDHLAQRGRAACSRLGRRRGARRRTSRRPAPSPGRRRSASAGLDLRGLALGVEHACCAVMTSR